MHGFVLIYGMLWILLLVVAPTACIYQLIKAPSPQTPGRTRAVALLGLLLTVWLMLTLAVTTLQPLALVVLPAALILVAGIGWPFALARKGVRIYVISCIALGELFWIWAAWDQFIHFPS